MQQRHRSLQEGSRAPNPWTCRHTSQQQVQLLRPRTRRSRCIATLAQLSAGASDKVFNRMAEKKELAALCRRPPTGISLILGPRNTGKSCLLKDFFSQPNMAGRSSYISLQDLPPTNPSELARAILRYTLQPLVAQSGKVTAVPEGLAAALRVGTRRRSASADTDTPAAAGAGAPGAVPKDAAAQAVMPEYAFLSEVLSAYPAVLRGWEAAEKSGRVKGYPVLVLDEAHMLMDWSSDPHHDQDLQYLLNTLVAVTKRDKNAVVILCSSEARMQSWLMKRVGSLNVNTYLVGDLPEEEARRLVDHELLKQGRFTISDAHWRIVYQVCGGNAGALCNAVAFFSACEDWTQAVDTVAEGVWAHIDHSWQRALQGTGAGYSSEEASKVFRALIDSRYKSVGYHSLTHTLGVSALTLDAMERDQLVTTRPKCTSWSRDLPVEAWRAEAGGTTQEARVVTAASAVHYHVIETYQRQLTTDMSETQGWQGRRRAYTQVRQAVGDLR